MGRMVAMQRDVAAFIKTMQEYPPMQKGGSFNLDAVLQKAKSVHQGAQQ
jgi:hypothetical protein